MVGTCSDMMFAILQLELSGVVRQIREKNVLLSIEALNLVQLRIALRMIFSTKAITDSPHVKKGSCISKWALWFSRKVVDL